MDKYQAILEELKTWNKEFINLLIRELMLARKINFPDFIRYYNEYLDKERDGYNEVIQQLILHLGLECGGEKRNQMKNARRYLWEQGFFARSKFGEELEQEFKNEKD